MNKDLEKYSDADLKVFFFDEQAKAQQVQTNMKIIMEELNFRNKAASEAPKGPTIEEKEVPKKKK